ncbi:Type III secretion system protein PrgH-EprH (PrgH) [Sodalis glossinidius str. 'morsitans']|nr:Type III secretion system protein PrgH-EprH (PrgH) [Sodalis glossinidius str. 'morsitans']
MNKENDHVTLYQDGLVLRLLNGLLKGCEYRLNAPVTLFVASDAAQAERRHEPPFLPPETIFIPHLQGGVNFEIVIDFVAPHKSALRVLVDGGISETPLVTNRVLTAGPQALVVRPAAAAWDDTILNFQEMPAPAMTTQRRRRGSMVLLSLMVLVGAGYLLQNYAIPGHEDAAALGKQLTGAQGKFHLLPGKDGSLYMLASSERDAALGRQSLVRHPTAAVKVVSCDDERRRVHEWLGRYYPWLGLHRIHIDDPSAPQLILSRQRAVLSPAERERLSAALLDILPYARQISFGHLDDDAVASDAENGLRQLAIGYARVDHPDSVTFVINGALEDGERQRIRRYLEAFKQRWSSNYVQFTVELRDDPIAGKSFSYGQQNFVKPNAGHWYFTPSSSH